MLHQLETTQRNELMNKEMVWFNTLCTCLAAKRGQEKVNTEEMDEKWMMRIWRGGIDGWPPAAPWIEFFTLYKNRTTKCWKSYEELPNAIQTMKPQSGIWLAHMFCTLHALCEMSLLILNETEKSWVLFKIAVEGVKCPVIS